MPNTHTLFIAQPDGFIRREEGHYEGYPMVWVCHNSRLATNDEIKPCKQPILTQVKNTIPIPKSLYATTGGSGSHGTHARKNASSAKRWMNCTASVAYIAANRASILINKKIPDVIKLTPYLLSMPKEEVQDYEWRAVELCAKHAQHKVKASAFTPEQVSDIERSASSEAAREGTRAHDYAEAILRGRKTLEGIPEEFRVPVGTYVDHCRSLGYIGYVPMIESKVPLFYDPGDTGTVDFAIADETDPKNVRIIIRDYKHGAGVFVPAEDNEQLAIYAIGLVDKLESDPDLPTTFNPLTTIIDIGIVQPRHHEGGEIRTWQITLNDLRRFVFDIGLAAKRINAGDVEFAPSENACRWCDMKERCDPRTKALAEAYASPDCDGVDYLSALPDLSKEDSKAPVEERLTIRKNTANDDLVMPESSALVLTDDKVMQVFANTKAIKAWLADIEEYVETRALAGDNFGGRVKLVLGRKGNRAWKDEKAADVFLTNQGMKEKERYTYTLKTPTQAEELLGARMKVKRTASRMSELTTRGDAKPVVALASDKRAAIEACINMLPELEEEGLN